MAVSGFYFDASMWQPVGVTTATEKKNPLGPTGERVRQNVERLRTARGLSKTELSDRTGQVGRRIPPLGISRIEAGTRRVDADDLVALALALNVGPATLLMPPNAGRELIDLTPSRQLSAGFAWLWAVGQRTAMDWQPGEGVSLAGPGVDPAISEDAYEKEQEFNRLQVEYEALAGPAELRRGGSNQAVRLARLLTDFVVDLVAPEPGTTRSELATRARLAMRRYRQLGDELEEIAEQLPAVHPGIAPSESEQDGEQ